MKNTFFILFFFTMLTKNTFCGDENNYSGSTFWIFQNFAKYLSERTMNEILPDAQKRIQVILQDSLFPYLKNETIELQQEFKQQIDNNFKTLLVPYVDGKMIEAKEFFKIYFDKMNEKADQFVGNDTQLIKKNILQLIETWQEIGEQTKKDRMDLLLHKKKVHYLYVASITTLSLVSLAASFYIISWLSDCYNTYIQRANFISQSAQQECS